jgi:hypothetical protein
MNYSEFKLDENNKINIFANMVIKDALSSVKEKEQFFDFFKKGNRNNIIDKYVFYFTLAEKNMELFMDSTSILDSKLIGGKYNSFLKEDNIILLFMKLKIYILSGISELDYDSVFKNIYDKKIIEYETFLEEDTLLINKDLDKNTRIDLITKKIQKVKLSSVGFYLILSYYIYIYKSSQKTNINKKNFILFIDKVDNRINDFFNNNGNLNIQINDFWKYLISCI